MIEKIIINNSNKFDKDLLEYTLQIRALNFLDEKKELEKEVYEKSKEYIKKLYCRN